MIPLIRFSTQFTRHFLSVNFLESMMKDNDKLPSKEEIDNNIFTKTFQKQLLEKDTNLTSSALPQTPQEQSQYLQNLKDDLLFLKKGPKPPSIDTSKDNEPIVDPFSTMQSLNFEFKENISTPDKVLSPHDSLKNSNIEFTHFPVVDASSKHLVSNSLREYQGKALQVTSIGFGLVGAIWLYSFFTSYSPYNSKNSNSELPIER